MHKKSHPLSKIQIKSDQLIKFCTYLNRQEPCHALHASIMPNFHQKISNSRSNWSWNLLSCLLTQTNFKCRQMHVFDEKMLHSDVTSKCYTNLYLPPKVLPKQGAELQILCWKIAQSNQVVQIMTHATSFTQNQSQIWLKILFSQFHAFLLGIKMNVKLFKSLDTW